METKFVIFRLGEERYGLPIEKVERIVPALVPTKLPRSSKALLGIFELRGQTIPVLDARIRFELPEYNDAKAFVIVLTPSGSCALRVDEVVGIIELSEKEKDVNPSILKNEKDDFIAGIGKKNDQLTLLLDPDNLVPTDLRSKVASACAKSADGKGKKELTLIA